MIHSIILVDPAVTLTARPDSNTMVVDLVEGEKVITIKQIKELVLWAGQHGFSAGAKRGVVLQAQRWHYTAADALLKTLEEPVADTTIILTTNNPASLPETIRSRCAVVQLEVVDPNRLTEWGLYKKELPPGETFMAWDEFCSLERIQRWQAMEPLLKAKKDMSLLISSWEQQASNQLLRSINIDQTQELVGRLQWLTQAHYDLGANILPRLVFDTLLLHLDQQSTPRSA